MNKNRFSKRMTLIFLSVNMTLLLIALLIIGITKESVVNREQASEKSNEIAMLQFVTTVEASSKLIDGVYVLLTDVGINDWSTHHSIEVDDGVVLHSWYDTFDAEGNSRLENPVYRDAVDTLNSHFVETGDPPVDIVAGAERISHEFRVTAAMVLALAEHGMHDGIIVSRLPLTDGEYIVNSVDNQSMTLVVENEEIVSLVIEGDSVNQAAAEALVESLLSTQDIRDVEAPETADAETKADFDYLAMMALEAIGQAKLATIHEMAAENAE